VEWRVPLGALRRDGRPRQPVSPSLPTSPEARRAPSDARIAEGQADGGVCLAHETLPRLEERIAGLQTAVESLAARVESLADESARLRDEVIRGVRLPVVSVVQSLAEANAELREQLTHVTVGCRKLAQFIFDLEEVTNGSGTGAK
jgi:predicted RNase H-like nuclease (RuvC/YqgF family)